VSVVAFAAVGCGGGKTSVKGTVTANGKPVVWGTVILVDAAGAYHQGEIKLDGKYEISDLPAGEVKIGVTSPDPVDPRSGGRGNAGGRGGAPKKGGVTIDDPRGKPADSPRPTPPPGAWFPLPNAKMIADPMQSGMTGEVKAGQSLDIVIK